MRPADGLRELGPLGGRALVAYCVGIYVVSRIVEGPRHADGPAGDGADDPAFCVVLVPLVSVVWTVVQRGWARMDAEFFTSTMRGVIGDGGGIWHAIVGTFIITGLTTLMSVPFGIMSAIYLVEYGSGRLAGRSRRWST